MFLRPFLRGFLVAAALPLLPLGCSSDAFGCLEAEQCGDGGQCESNGYCSFEDDSCASGRRFAANATDGVANVCVPVASSTGAMGSGSSTSTPTSTAPEFTSTTSFGSTEDTGGSGNMGTDSSGYFGTFGSGGFDTSGGTSNSGGFTSSSSTAGAVDCIEDNPRSCGGCFECSDTQACSNLAEVCGTTATCPEVNACLSACKAGGVCFDDCCEGYPGDAVEAAMALSACHQDSCISAHCPTFPPAECNG